MLNGFLKKGYDAISMPLPSNFGLPCPDMTMNCMFGSNCVSTILIKSAPVFPAIFKSVRISLMPGVAFTTSMAVTTLLATKHS